MNESPSTYSSAPYPSASHSSATTAQARRGSPVRTMLAVVLLAFVLGGAATWYVFGKGPVDLSDIARFRTTEPAVATGPTPAPAPAALPSTGMALALADGGLDQRVAAMEQRLARLDLQAQAAAGNAGRAEGLLIVFASRRALDRGAPLGYLEDQLRLRFMEAQPGAVRTIVAAGRDPLTMDQLLGRLDTLAPQLAAAPSDDGFFDRMSRELGQIFVVRREGTPSPAPEKRLERARMFLESGRPDAAAAEVRLLPNAAVAADWLSDAERFAEAQRALDVLETTAILEPRALRDGGGTRIEQPSPVVGGGN